MHSYKILQAYTVLSKLQLRRYYSFSICLLHWNSSMFTFNVSILNKFIGDMFYIKIIHRKYNERYFEFWVYLDYRVKIYISQELTHNFNSLERKLLLLGPGELGRLIQSKLLSMTCQYGRHKIHTSSTVWNVNMAKAEI